MADLPPVQTSCPECGEEATDESIRKRELSALGYQHEDVRYDCPECETTWVHGIPEGETNDNRWVCDSCGGDYMPHFLFVNLSDNTIRTRPKCMHCYHVPKERVEILGKFNGENIRGFVGHHRTTGDRTKAQGDPI